MPKLNERVRIAEAAEYLGVEDIHNAVHSWRRQSLGPEVPGNGQPSSKPTSDLPR